VVGYPNLAAKFEMTRTDMKKQVEILEHAGSTPERAAFDWR
jgi:biotin operon repressor